MNYLFMLLLFIQTASGQVTVTLQDNQGAPVNGETIELSNEQGQALGSCATNANGRCTITVEGVPADLSGFIRGAIIIPGRGRRPVIWPGGQLDISITLDPAGQIFVPSDHYITQTPESTETPTPESTETPTPESTETPTPESTETPTPESTKTQKGAGAPESTLTPRGRQTPENHQESNDTTNFRQILIQFIFIVTFIILAIIYFVASKRI